MSEIIFEGAPNLGYATSAQLAEFIADGNEVSQQNMAFASRILLGFIRKGKPTREGRRTINMPDVTPHYSGIHELAVNQETNNYSESILLNLDTISLISDDEQSLRRIENLGSKSAETITAFMQHRRNILADDEYLIDTITPRIDEVA